MGLIADMASQAGLIRDYGVEASFPLAGAERALADLSGDESQELVNKLDALFMEENNPAVARMVGESMPDIIRTVQAVKEETKVDFQGMVARGNALDVNLLRAEDFTRINGTTTPVSWLNTYTAVGDTDWLGTPANVETMSENQAFIFLGVIDPIETPKLDGILFYRFADPIGPTQALSLNMKSGFGSNQVAVQKFHRPVLMLPEANFNVVVNVRELGDDRLQPVGLIVARRSDIGNLVE